MKSAVAVLFSRLGPYHAARLQAAARHFPVVAIEFEADSSVYAWDRVPTSESIERHTLVLQGDAAAAPRWQVAKRLFAVLDEVRPAAIALPGWEYSGSLLALAWALKTNTPTIMMSESQRQDASRSRGRELAKQRIVKLCAAALVGGQRHAEYIHELGLRKQDIFTGYDIVDNDYFAHGAARAREQAQEHRALLGLPERYFLASNRFVAKKNLPTLLGAFARYRHQAGDAAWKLVLLGDGPLKPELLDLQRKLGLENDLIMPGFRQIAELPIYYGLASAFVHASFVEQWGLVVNEAMASGLPVIVSRACGCVPDLVVDGDNGLAFDPHDEAQLTSALTTLSSDPERLQLMGQRSLDLVARLSPAAFGEGLDQARRAAVASSRPRVRGIDWALVAALALR